MTLNPRTVDLEVENQIEVAQPRSVKPYDCGAMRMSLICGFKTSISVLRDGQIVAIEGLISQKQPPQAMHSGIVPENLISNTYPHPWDRTL